MRKGEWLEGSGFGLGTAVFNDVRQMSICKGVSSYHGVYSFVLLVVILRIMCIVPKFIID
jgi:hypothetical protein